MPRTGVVLRPRYIYVEEEGGTPPPDRHELNLLKEYQVPIPPPGPSLTLPMFCEAPPSPEVGKTEASFEID